MIRNIVASVVAVLLMAGSAFAQDPMGRASAGKEMALELCTECHFVAKDQKAPVMRIGPSFYELADDPAVTAFRLRVFLQQTPHPIMPNFILSDGESDDITAYILGLRAEGR